jgi:hypothetical protein
MSYPESGVLCHRDTVPSKFRELLVVGSLSRLPSLDYLFQAPDKNNLQQ